MSKKPEVVHALAGDGRSRCRWVASGNELYFRYHDQEWGVPVRDDRTHFEFLVLEGAQAGLSWSTVLNKRQAYQRAFANFDYEKIARLNARSVTRLLANPGIIRNRAKIESTIENARRFIAIREEFGSFDRYVWRFVDGRPRQNIFRRHRQVPATSRESDALSKDLKQRGLRFVGSTIIYAHMQAVGMVNDHLLECFRYEECKALGW
ncbi:MAG TPA: DNA-3-methyladenine glycosylase I [Steroidobacteraceae bacterium]|nr:DNA-3-methyladenine glycosylase I [Steroidobacteraceae bacterium]